MPSASSMAPVVRDIIEKASAAGHLVVASQDWHPVGHVSFASSHPEGTDEFSFVRIPVSDELRSSREVVITRESTVQHEQSPDRAQALGSESPQRTGAVIQRLKSPKRALKMDDDNFVLRASSTPTEDTAQSPERHEVDLMVFPQHCVQGTSGAELIPELAGSPIDILVKKGQRKDMEFQSAFKDVVGIEQSGLELILRVEGVETVVIAGVATEHCVCASALDSVSAGFRTIVLTDAIMSVNHEKGEKALKKMASQGVELFTWPQYCATINQERFQEH